MVGKNFFLYDAYAFASLILYFRYIKIYVLLGMTKNRTWQKKIVFIRTDRSAGEK